MSQTISDAADQPAALAHVLTWLPDPSVHCVHLAVAGAGLGTPYARTYLGRHRRQLAERVLFLIRVDGVSISINVGVILWRQEGLDLQLGRVLRCSLAHADTGA